jgi:hypothetical protein
VSEEERDRRINGYLADALYGEKAYRVRQHLERAGHRPRHDDEHETGDDS